MSSKRNQWRLRRLAPAALVGAGIAACVIGPSDSGPADVRRSTRSVGSLPALPGDVIVPADLTSDGTVAGDTEGSFSVGNDGAAGYSIPIWVPPGRAGIQPALALAYDSSAGEGVAGVGWSLKGGHGISRCTRTVRQDGQSAPIAFSSDDAFCLDGQRMILVQPGLGYPSNYEGTVYRLEMDDFSQIRAHADVSGPPVSFEVRRKNGLIEQYGLGARLQGMRTRSSVSAYQPGVLPEPALTTEGPVTLTWPISEVHDRYSNSMTYTYQLIEHTTSEPGMASSYELALQSISYTAGVGFSANKTVELHYDSKPIRTGYVSGFAVSESLALTRIDVEGPLTATTQGVLRRYVLTQAASASTGRYVLQRVEECIGATGPCKRPTTFATTANTETFTRASYPAASGAALGGTIVTMTSGDVNGDGRDDLLFYLDVVSGQSGREGWYEMLSTSAQTGALSAPVFMEDLDPASPASHYPALHAGGQTPLRVMDINGDGRGDLIAFRHYYAVVNGVRSDVLSLDAWIAEPGTPVRFTYFSSPTLPSQITPAPPPSPLVPSGFVSGDVTGDGATDFVVTLPNDQQVLTALSDSPVTSASLSTILGYTFIEDIDGDGTPELLGHGGDPSWWYAAAKWNGSAFQATPFGLVFGQELGAGLSDNFLDMNGDGLADCMSVGWDPATSIMKSQVAINLGLGFGKRKDWFPLLNGWLDQVNGFIPWDYDGDGRQDLLLYRSAANHSSVSVLRSLGNQWQVLDLQDSTGAPLPIADVGWYPSKVTATLDANGDGQPDIAEIVGGQLRVYLRDGTAPDLLTSVTTPLGAVTTIEYGTLADPAVGSSDCTAVTCEPALRPLTKGRVVSGYWLPTGNVTRQHYRRQYGNGRTDMLGRGWLGFESVTSVQDATGVTSTTHSLNTLRISGIYPYAGLPSRVETRLPLDADHSRFERTQTAYSVTQPNPGTFFVREDSSISELFEGPNASTPGPSGQYGFVTVTHGAYDAYGNELNRTVATGDGDVVSTVWTYDPADTANWFVGKLTRIATTSTDAHQRSRTVTTAFSVDPVKGSLASQTAEPDSTDPSVHEVISYGRNANGLVTSTVATALGGETRGFQVGYDPEEGAFPTTLTNDLGQSAWLRYHPGLGLVAVGEDANGVSTSQQYDGFGRPKAIHPPGSASSTATYRRPSGDLGIAVELADDTGADTLVTSDAVANTVKAESEGVDGLTSRVFTEYDAFGRMARTSRPTRNAQGDAWETFQYDNLSRVTRVTHPDGAYLEATYSRRQIDSWDERRVQRRLSSDQSGRVIRSSIFPGGVESATIYEYGPFNQVVKTTDPGGHDTTVTYDARGRRESVDKPDSHLTSYTYNAFGEQATATDAEGRVTQVVGRDALGRATRITSPDGDSTFVWDTALGAGIGRLALATSPDGTTTSYLYDQYGRLATTFWQIPSVPELATTSFNLSRSYDSAGRVSGITYPTFLGSSFRTGATFGANGQLNAVYDSTLSQRYWQLASVAPDGSPLSEVFGAGTTTEHFYDLRGRERFLHTFTATQDIQKLAYRYDAGSNLISRSDLVGRTTEDFQYDDLNRLVHWTAYQACGISETELVYDADGDLLFRNILQGPGASIAFGYTGPSGGPHAVKQSDLGSYTYDLTGNQITGPGRTVAFNAFSLPTTVVTPAGQLSFKYDAQHKRVLKRSDNGDYEVTLGDAFLLRSTGGRREQVMRIGNGTRAVAEIHRDQQPNGALSDRVVYLHDDSVGSIESVTDSSGQVVDRRKYDPFGERRRPANLAQAWVPPPGTSDGFAGHRYDDELGLVNMGGRLYDPHTTRFLSADPQVPDWMDGQSFNPYAYVRNNPLRYTDPSGFTEQPGKKPAGPGTNQAPEVPRNSLGEIVVEGIGPKKEKQNWDVGHTLSPGGYAPESREATGSDAIDRSPVSLPGAGAGSRAGANGRGALRSCTPTSKYVRNLPDKLIGEYTAETFQHWVKTPELYQALQQRQGFYVPLQKWLGKEVENEFKNDIARKEAESLRPMAQGLEVQIAATLIPQSELAAAVSLPEATAEVLAAAETAQAANAAAEAEASGAALTSLEDVAKYVAENGELPGNYITKAEAESLGWVRDQGNLADVAPGKSIGGDVFYNDRGLLPDAPGRTWFEADLNYTSGYRGADRLLYSNDGEMFSTVDHYKTFTRVNLGP